MNSDYLVGTVLENRYEILEMIGSGGMATVYKAKCRVLNRYVAIKVLKDSLKYDMDVVKRFNAESRAAAGLSHPNIVQVYDVSETGGLDYIVMEYVDGITLKAYIKSHGALPWREACGFAVQIGKALECAHKNHIIHKDIKPHNVLLTRDGMLKVADFGIAQAATTETRVANNSNIGSVHYFSPEQGRGGYIDERSDIYSLGVVLYEMLTGKLPFDGENAVAIAIMKLEKEPVDCRIVNPSIPDGIGKITMKAISKEQYARYQTAGEMVADLEALTKDSIKPVAEKPDDEKFETRRIGLERIEERRKRKKHNDKITKRIAAIIAAVVLSIAAILAISTLAYRAFSGSGGEYRVPNVVGMTAEEAEAKLLEEAKMLVTIEKEKSTEVEKGLVIRQNVEEDRLVKKNHKITIWVSTGESNEDETDTAETEGKEVTVPKVTNMTAEKAGDLLDEQKLKYEITYRENDSVEEGHVISQYPAAGEKLEEGSKVKLIVSSGEGKVTVPNLSGYTKEKAELALKEAELAIGTVSEQENAAAKGTVIEQSYAQGAKVGRGTSVNITLSKGLPKKNFTVSIPDDSPDVVNVKVVANGKTIHDKDHAKSEDVSIDVQAHSGTSVKVQVYIDGKLVVERQIDF